MFCFANIYKYCLQGHVCSGRPQILSPQHSNLWNVCNMSYHIARKNCKGWNFEKTRFPAPHCLLAIIYLKFYNSSVYPCTVYLVYSVALAIHCKFTCIHLTYLLLYVSMGQLMSSDFLHCQHSSCSNSSVHVQCGGAQKWNCAKVFQSITDFRIFVFIVPYLQNYFELEHAASAVA